MSADHEAALAELLAGLGDTPDAVADRLRALGIKGVRQNPCACPIANLLHANGYDHDDLEVCADWIYPIGSGDDVDGMPPPRPVATFIRRFDRGVYLDLVEVAG